MDEVAKNPTFAGKWCELKINKPEVNVTIG
jgi:hypothetical protein